MLAGGRASSTRWLLAGVRWRHSSFDGTLWVVVGGRGTRALPGRSLSRLTAQYQLPALPPSLPSPAALSSPQKYWHKGAFFQGDDEAEVLGGVLQRSYDGPTGEDRFNKEALPKIMQVGAGWVDGWLGWAGGRGGGCGLFGLLPGWRGCCPAQWAGG